MSVVERTGQTQGDQSPAVIVTSPIRRALDWVHRHRIPDSGVVVHHRTRSVTQEVTGYLIPSLLHAGEAALAYELALWEASVQRPDGSLAAPDDVAYTFDTAQVARGFLAALDVLPQLEVPLRRACDYVVKHIARDGRVTSKSLDMWKLVDGSILTDYCNLYVLPPLFQAGHRLNEPRYIDAASRSLEYYCRRPDLTTFKGEPGTFTHMFGYMMEALVDCGQTELAAAGLAQAEAIQQPDGSIPAYPGASWVCSTGMAQLAIAWFKIGVAQPAQKAVTYLERMQHRSGGFFGSYGKGAIYFTREEISWAVKFFIDAELLAADAAGVPPAGAGVHAS